MGLAFFPRGGSAHVARNLAAALGGAGWDVAVLSGSLTKPGEPGDAREFYAGLDVRPVDMTAAIGAPDPMRADPPMHPSYEDRPGAPDRVFASLDDDEYERQVVAWCRALQSVDAANADILHLHHLTPIHEAAGRVAPGVPVVGHLHGTELLMLEAIADDPGRWAHAEVWAERMRAWAAGCERVIVLSETQVARAETLLGLDPDRCVLVPNGYDPVAFTPRHLDHAAHWRRHLVDEPRGWRPGGEPVALHGGRSRRVHRRRGRDAGAALRRPLHRGQAAAAADRGLRARPAGVRAPRAAGDRRRLPGRVGGRAPVDAIERVGARDVFLAGWHGHDELPDFLAASDVVVLPSVREQFGQVLVEGMACGLPAIAVDAWGPADIVSHGETGWLVEPDDVVSLANALVHAVNCPDERRRRGLRGAEVAAERYSWPALALEVAGVYDAACGSGAALELS